MRIRFLVALVAAIAVPASAQIQDDSFQAFGGNQILLSPVADAVPSTGSSAGSSVTFDHNPDGALVASGPSNLSDTLTVNSTAMTVVASYDARNATATTWAGSAGPTLTLTAGTRTLGTAPFTETAARSAVLSANTNRYSSATDTTTGNIASNEDFVIEVIACAPPAGSAAYPFAKSSGAGLSGTGGWWVGITSVFDISIGDGTTTRSLAAGTAAGACYHLMVFGDHDQATLANSLVLFINGASSGFPFSGALSALGAIAGSSSMTMMNLGGGNYGQVTGGVIAARLWKCTACMAGGATNPTQWLAIAQQRSAQLTGAYPAIALGGSTPSTATRASIATVDIDRDGDGISRSFLVGANWIRTARRVDGNAAYIEGAIIEPQSTNLALQSNALGTTWTPANGAITSNTRADAFGETVLDSYESTDAAGNVAHCDDQPITLTATTYTASAVYYRSEAVGFALLEDSTIANGKAWFNLSTCATATAQAGVSRSSTKALSSTLCHVSMSFTGTAAAHTIRLCGATADNVATYDDGTNATADWTAGTVQVEAQPIHTSTIPTTTATATRVKDMLEFAGAGNVVTGTPGTAEVSLLCDSTGAFGAGYRWGGYADTTAANGLYFESDSTQTKAQYFSTAGAAGIASTTTDVPDGLIHTLRSTTSTNSHKIYFDTVVGGTVDTTVDLIPASTITRINIGSNGAAATGGQSTCLYGRTRFWSSAVAP